MGVESMPESLISQVEVRLLREQRRTEDDGGPGRSTI
jgi:hypothetical protein